MLLNGKEMITKEYTKIFFNNHSKEKKFYYTCNYNGVAPYSIGIVEFELFEIFDFQKLKKLEKIAKKKEFFCWCPFYHIDNFWAYEKKKIRKAKLKKLKCIDE